VFEAEARKIDGSVSFTGGPAVTIKSHDIWAACRRA
jgi:hypothetical protein